jgi:hypothetical protein
VIRAGIALGFVLGVAGSAVAQEACLRPVQPEAVRPPADDAEFREFLNEEYQAYLLDAQEYLNCLGREHESATKEAREIMARWILWFGDDARFHSQEPSRSGPALSR